MTLLANNKPVIPNGVRAVRKLSALSEGSSFRSLGFSLCSLVAGAPHTGFACEFLDFLRLCMARLPRRAAPISCSGRSLGRAFSWVLWHKLQLVLLLL